MHVFSLPQEQSFSAKHHVEKILATVGEGDVTVACWEPGQISPYHCHPEATEIYFCFEGGGTVRRRDHRRDYAWLLRRASGRGVARIRERARAHTPVPHPLRPRHGLAPHRLAGQGGLGAAPRGCGLFRQGDEPHVKGSACGSTCSRATASAALPSRAATPTTRQAPIPSMPRQAGNRIFCCRPYCPLSRRGKRDAVRLARPHAQLIAIDHVHAF